MRSRRTMITTRLFRMGVFAFVLVLPFIGAAAAPDQGSPDARGPTATSSLIREIQFMLLSLGFDPGPIDGNARLLTNRAARLFQQRNGLPGTDIVNNYPISPSFLETLRREAAQVLLKNARPETRDPLQWPHNRRQNLPQPHRGMKLPDRLQSLRPFRRIDLPIAPTVLKTSSSVPDNIPRRRSLTKASMGRLVALLATCDNVSRKPAKLQKRLVGQLCSKYSDKHVYYLTSNAAKRWSRPRRLLDKLQE